MIRVLVTNDDGIAAPGLRSLAAAAIDAGLDVVVAAPAEETSGASAGLSAVYENGRLALDRTTLNGFDGPAYSVRATPSYIVVLATLGSFGRRPDVVLSGINRGANAGHAVLHSGTAGAAFTAAAYGVRAMAVSLDVLDAVQADPTSGGAALGEALANIVDTDLHWSTAGHFAAQLLPVLTSLPDDVILNVNAPNRPLDGVRGIRQATLAPFGQVQMAVAENGESFVRITVKAAADRHEAGTDIAAISDGFVSVTPIATMRAFELDLGL